jgi:eukaryotic-like serine/threonine-protein kinase
MKHQADVRTISHYRLLEKLGSGGMGEVYLAEDTALGRKVAIKVLPATLAKDRNASLRLMKEAQAAAQLDHPNICSIYEAGEDDGVPFIAMQLIEGESLADRMTSRTLGEDERLEIATQVADALSETHGRGLVHRDVKPQNVMVNRRGQAKLMDFGLAKAFARSAPDPDEKTEQMLTTPGSIVGTVAYLSPEQVRGEEADARSDVWAFGVMLHELTTGAQPFSGKSAAEMMSAILRDEPATRPAQIDPSLGSVIDRCLKKNPGERFQDAGQLHSALQMVRSKVEAQPASVPQRSSATPAMREAPTGRIQSIAVLPLENHSVDPEQDYFADAMTESLLTDLAQIGGLRVVSRTSVMRYKGTLQPLPQIAAELGVDAILEGSVLRVGHRVRITAQLIHGSTDQHLWAKSYERDAEDILTLLSEVANAVVEAVRVELTPHETTRLTAVRRVDRAAHEAYLKGIYHFDRLDMGRGMELFTESTRIDPTYAPAWGRLARGYYYLGLFGAISPADAFSALKDAAWKAQDLDPDLAEAYGWRAMASLYYDWNWSATGEELRYALELKPSHAELSHLYAHYLMVMGESTKGIVACERAIELDPFGTILTACVGWHCLFSRQIEDAIPPVLRALAMDPNLFWAHTILGWAYEQQGKADQSIAEYEQAVALSGGMVLNVSALGHALANFGRVEESNAVLDQLLERRKSSYVSAYDIATIHVALKDVEGAFHWLEEAFKERSSFLIHTNWDPRLDVLRSDPRLAALVRRIGLPALTLSAGTTKV